MYDSFSSHPYLHVAFDYDENVPIGCIHMYMQWQLVLLHILHPLLVMVYYLVVIVMDHVHFREFPLLLIIHMSY